MEVIIFICLLYYGVKRYIQYEDNEAERRHDDTMTQRGYNITWTDTIEGPKKEYIKGNKRERS